MIQAAQFFTVLEEVEQVPGRPLVVSPPKVLHTACQLPGQDKSALPTAYTCIPELSCSSLAPHIHSVRSVLRGRLHTKVTFLMGESQVSKLNHRETAGATTLGHLSLTSESGTLGEASTGWEAI